jgi:hypothetical protein
MGTPFFITFHFTTFFSVNLAKNISHSITMGSRKFKTLLLETVVKLSLAFPMYVATNSVPLVLTNLGKSLKLQGDTLLFYKKVAFHQNF